MGVLGDFNQRLVSSLDQEYFEYLRDLGVNWVGISVALYVDDSLDSTVERKYQAIDIPTYRDDELRRLIKELRHHNFQVYLTLAFEDAKKAKDHPYHRSQLGALQDRNDWPWNPDHPDHKRFVQEFWQSYADQAVHFAQIASDEGVSLFSLGTETEGLFRTRELGGQPGGYKRELAEMIKRVRQVFNGKVSYDSHSFAYTPKHPDPEAIRSLWRDLDFDLIGISAYFSPLTDPPETVTSLTKLEAGWKKILTEYLLPLKKEFPDKPIVFLEYLNKTSLYAGYDGPLTDDRPEPNNLLERKLTDRNSNQIDDAMEQQANVHQALFNVIDQEPGLIDGIFFWGEDYWDKSSRYSDEEGVRGKPAQKVIADWYSRKATNE